MRASLVEVKTDFSPLCHLLEKVTDVNGGMINMGKFCMRMTIKFGCNGVCVDWN